MAVVIEIAHPDRFPAWSWIGAHGPAPDQAVPAHFPDRGLPGVRVLPQNVGMAVVIEIAGPGLDPTRPGIRAHRPPANDVRPAHVPNRHLTIRVLPQDVGRTPGGVEAARRRGRWGR